MSDFLNRVFYGNTVGQWAVALLIVLGFVVAGKILYWFINRVVKRITAKTQFKLDDILVDMAEEPLVFAMAVAGLWFGFSSLTVSASVQTFGGRVMAVLITLAVAWGLTRLLDALVTEYIEPVVRKTEGDLDDQLLPIVRKGLKLTIWALAIIIALDNAGYNVGAILAGLGIGGLAFALAAQDTVSNLFGGITILMDKPFSIRDRIKINGFDGMIEEIGLRSTRLKTLEGRIVTIPNSTFTQNPIENISSEPSRKVAITLGLTYDMNETQVQQAIEILKEIVASNDHVEENALTSFSGFGDFSLNVLFIYYIKKESDILGTMTEMNLEILRRFNEAGLEFAFPSQTIYAKQI
jgi:MscS family membrane protein